MSFLRWYNFCAIIPLGFINRFGNFFDEESFFKAFFGTLGILGTIFQVICLVVSIIYFKQNAWGLNIEDDLGHKILKKERRVKIRKVKFKNFIKNFNLKEFLKKEINLKELHEKFNKPLFAKKHNEP